MRDPLHGIKTKLMFVLLLVGLSFVTYSRFIVRTHGWGGFRLRNEEKGPSEVNTSVEHTRTPNPKADVQLQQDDEDDFDYLSVAEMDALTEADDSSEEESIEDEEESIEDEEDDPDIKAKELPVFMVNGNQPTRCDLLRRSAKWSDVCNATGTEPPLPFLVTGIGRSGTKYLQELLTALGLKVGHDSKKSCPEKNQCPGEDGAVSWVHPFAKNRIITEEAPERLSDRCYLPGWAWSPRQRRFRHIIHLVRDPIKTIASRANMELSSVQRWFLKSIPCYTHVVGQAKDDLVRLFLKQGQRKRQARRQQEDTPYLTLSGRIAAKLVLTTRHYITWNSFVEHVSDYRVRVEDIGVPVVLSLCQLADPGGKKSDYRCTPDEIMNTMASLGTEVHHGHVKRRMFTSESVTWQRLALLDLEAASLAQRLARRYGYVIAEDQLLSSSVNSSNGAVDYYGFSKGGRWYYRLRGAPDEKGRSYRFSDTPALSLPYQKWFASDTRVHGHGYKGRPGHRERTQQKENEENEEGEEYKGRGSTNREGRKNQKIHVSWIGDFEVGQRDEPRRHHFNFRKNIQRERIFKHFGTDW